MTCEFATAEPSGTLFRIGRRGQVWQWPDWAYAAEDGTFGNRYDDPESEYRVLYASSQRIGTFLETLARFRPDPAVLAAAIETDPQDEDFPTAPPGTVPGDWIAKRSMGTARASGRFAAIGRSESLEHLRSALSDRLVHHGVADLDASTVRATAPRRLTQEFSRYIFECSTDSGDPAFLGVQYESRLGDEINNWAIFEPTVLQQPDERHLPEDDPDLLEVIGLFGLTLED